MGGRLHRYFLHFPHHFLHRTHHNHLIIILDFSISSVVTFVVLYIPIVPYSCGLVFGSARRVLAGGAGPLSCVPLCEEVAVRA